MNLHFTTCKQDGESYSKTYEIRHNLNTVDAAKKTFFTPNRLEKFMLAINPLKSDPLVQVTLAYSIKRAQTLRNTSGVTTV